MLSALVAFVSAFAIRPIRLRSWAWCAGALVIAVASDQLSPVAGLVCGAVAAMSGRGGPVSRSVEPTGQRWWALWAMASYVGLWATVPDTEVAVTVAAGGVVALGAEALRAPAEVVHYRWSAAAAALAVVAAGTAGRPEAVAGAILCLAAPALWSIVGDAGSEPSGRLVRGRAVAVGAAHAAAIVVASRVVAQEPLDAASVGLSVVALAVVAASVGVAAHRSP